MQWFTEGDNSDYIAPRAIAITSAEAQIFADSVRSLYQMLSYTARYVAQNNRWADLGIPPEAVRLMSYSIREEEHLHLIGRFDFAGGVDGSPLKFLEFNADTFSLLPETVRLQPKLTEQLQQGPVPASYQTYEHLVAGFRAILKQHPQRAASLLLTGMGYPEDTMNLNLIGEAAREAGFEVVQQIDLPNVIFSPDDGVFVELGPERFQKFEFVFKMIPWDFIVFEEPDLLDLLTEIICNKLAIVINPPCSMMLQSKGMLPLLYELYPNADLLLPAYFEEDKLDGRVAYVGKPMFGRMGENIEAYDNKGEMLLENEGDYGEFPYVYQQWASMDEDSRGYIYQPSVYWVMRDSGICFRRQEGIIIDDDASFVPHIVE